MRYALILGLLLCAVPSKAAISNCTSTSVGNGIICKQGVEVESDIASGTETSFTIVYGGAVAAGNNLVCVLRLGISTATGITAKDSVNGSVAWTLATSATDSTNGRELLIYYWQNTAGGTPTVTFNWTTLAGANGAACFEYSGLATTSSLDKVAGQCQTGTVTAGSTTSGSTATTTNAVDLLVGGITVGTSDTHTISSQNLSFVSVATDTMGTTAHSHINVSDETVASTGAYAFNPTMSGSITGGVCTLIATFKKAAAAATTHMPPAIY